MTAIPYVAIGSDELGEQTEMIRCPSCQDEHPIEYGTSKTLMPDGKTWSEPKPSRLLGFYKCHGKLYLGTVGGRKWR